MLGIIEVKKEYKTKEFEEKAECVFEERERASKE